MPKAGKPYKLCLATIKPKSQVTTLVRNERGRWAPTTCVFDVMYRDTLSKKWVYDAGKAGLRGKIPPGGEGWDGEPRKGTPPSYYFSANPVHLAQARRNAFLKVVRLDQEQQERRRRLAPAMPIVKHLDLVNCTDEQAAEALIRSFTPAQIETIKSWL